MNKLKPNGFTLIEILVVVAIVGILVTIVVSNFVGIRINARDARRKAELAQIQKALELYKSDQSPQAYPATGFNDTFFCNQCWSQGGIGICTGNIYMPKFPCDPQYINPSPYIFKIDESDNFKYFLSACIENTEDPDKDDSAISECADIGKRSYTVREP